jgi:hypothetical protein
MEVGVDTLHKGLTKVEQIKIAVEVAAFQHAVSSSATQKMADMRGVDSGQGGRFCSLFLPLAPICRYPAFHCGCHMRRGDAGVAVERGEEPRNLEPNSACNQLSMLTSLLSKPQL